MHISPSLLDSFSAKGALIEPSSDGDVLDLAFHPDWMVGHRPFRTLLRAFAGFAGTIRFGKMFRLSLFAMACAGISAALLVVTGNHIFSRLYGASVAVALVFSMGAAMAEFVRDKGEDGQGAVHKAPRGLLTPG